MEWLDHVVLHLPLPRPRGGLETDGTPASGTRSIISGGEDPKYRLLIG